MSAQVVKAGARGLPVGVGVFYLVAGVAFGARYARFAKYRIGACLWGAITTCTPSRQPPAPEAPKEVD